MAKRINFFTFLDTGETEWKNEQAYHRNKHLNHWLQAHGWGVIGGFRVTQTAPASLDVLIEPGFAIAPDGEEIIMELTLPYRLSLAEYVPPSGTRTMYVVAEHVAEETDPVFVDEIGEPRNSMIEDKTLLSAVEAVPAGNQVPLARVVLTSTATQVSDPVDPFDAGANEIDRSVMKRIPQVASGGPIIERPVAPVLYERYFATDIGENGKLIIWMGTGWVDAAGATVF